MSSYSQSATNSSFNLKSHKVLGTLAVIGASTIYAANFVISRYSVQESLSAYDLVLLRYLVAGVLLLPIVFRAGMSDLGGIGWKRGGILTLVAGFPYILLLIGGLHFAPVSHGSAINPGSIPIVVAVLTWAASGKAIPALRIFAFVLIAFGLYLVTGFGFSSDPNALLGDGLFLLSGICWGTYTFLVNRWVYPPLLVASVVAVGSLVLAPIGLLFFQQGITSAPISQVAIQAFNQGILNAIVALYLFSYGVQQLGPKLASLYSPSIPVLATLMAIPFLGELPSLLQWGAMGLIVFGMWLAARLS